MKRYTDKTCTQEELRELFAIIKQGESKDDLLAFMDETYKSSEINADVHQVDWDNVYTNITGGKPAKPVQTNTWIKYMVAAMLLLITSYGLWTLQRPQQQHQQVAAKKDVKAGGNKAVLTLANGSQITLDNAGKGIIRKENGIAIDKAGDGLLVYEAANDKQVAAVQNSDVPYNTLATPRAGQYHLVLPDGSNVWLNAASSITYPVAFADKTRKVTLSGEAYFEVAKDKTKPFIVQTADAEVKVLGTHFNVMAYPDDKVKETTLLEGAVQVAHLSHQQILKPGQQALFQAGVDQLQIKEIDAEDVIAWKNGLFLFDNHTIDDVMKQIERWYDLEIEYAGAKPQMSFTGVIPRNSNVSKVLHVLELTGGVRFEISGNKIIVKTIRKH
ncbi:FecR domain-containing protein [Mucilaginibacter sp. PAMB04168]|uniref:FecR family protein n=1 Tax=Mucilaginibacter sp. PAMB04168 TaxID=3138567 RepID=UPI00332C467B